MTQLKYLEQFNLLNLLNFVNFCKEFRYYYPRKFNGGAVKKPHCC